MENEEYLVRLSLLQEEAKKLEEQFKLISQEIANMEMVEKSIDELKDKKEILFQIGKGVFVSDKKKNEFFVNVGQGVVLKKNNEEVKKIIENQKKELRKVLEEITGYMENINLQIDEIIKEAKKIKE